MTKSGISETNSSQMRACTEVCGLDSLELRLLKVSLSIKESKELSQGKYGSLSFIISRYEDADTSAEYVFGDPKDRACFRTELVVTNEPMFAHCVRDKVDKRIGWENHESDNTGIL